MVAGDDAFRYDLPIIAPWLADYRNRWFAFQQLDLSYKHERPELPFVYPEPGSTVFYNKFPVLRSKFRTEHIGIGNIILTGGITFVGRVDKEVSPVVFIEQGAKQETAVEPGKTHPFYIGPGIDIGQVGAIADDTHIVLVR